jgi:hypothetical protein
MEVDPAWDKANQTLAVPAAIIDPIYLRGLHGASRRSTTKKTVEEIQWEAKEEIARAERLARELDKRKGHNGL